MTTTLFIPITTAGTHPRNGIILSPQVLEQTVIDWNNIHGGQYQCSGVIVPLATIPTSYHTPPNLSLTMISHVIRTLEWDAKLQTIVVEFRILDTPQGQILQDQYKAVKDSLVPFPVSKYIIQARQLTDMEIHYINLAISPIPYQYAWPSIGTEISSRNVPASDPFTDYDRAMSIL